MNRILRFTLSCGVVVELSAMYSENTYAGWLEGFPSSEHNADILARALTRMDAMWGKRATHLIQPTMSEFIGRPVLPSYTHFAELNSYEGIAPGSDGSSLVVIWLSDMAPDLSLPEVIKLAVADVPWREVAKSWEW